MHILLCASLTCWHSLRHEDIGWYCSIETTSKFSRTIYHNYLRRLATSPRGFHRIASSSDPTWFIHSWTMCCCILLSFVLQINFHKNKIATGPVTTSMKHKNSATSPCDKGPYMWTGFTFVNLCRNVSCPCKKEARKSYQTCCQG